MPTKHSLRPAAALKGILAVLLLAAAMGSCGPAAPKATARQTPRRPVPPTATATEPLLPPPPTRTVAAETAPSGPTLTVLWSSPAQTFTPAPSDSPADSAGRIPPIPTATRVSARAASPTAARAALYPARQRLGLSGGGQEVTQGVAERLGFGWYLDWGANPGNLHPREVEYTPMIRLPRGKPAQDDESLRALVPLLPGALWLIGNEPDVKWQDDVMPEAYAQAYHDLYALLKALDPTCRVAIGGVSQPTPLRMRYLEQILDAYWARYGEPMPVDVWNVHNFVLREERGSWGVDIPPGMPENSGTLREIDDHDSTTIFRQQILDFRRWMKAQGLQEKPLIVTEYGILMPVDYGFPEERVERFMLDSFAFFESAIDRDLGMPADGYRLVQRWCWFSLTDDRYPTGNLLAPDGALTPLGEAFARHAQRLR